MTMRTLFFGSMALVLFACAKEEWRQYGIAGMNDTTETDETEPAGADLDATTDATVDDDTDPDGGRANADAGRDARADAPADARTDARDATPG